MILKLSGKGTNNKIKTRVQKYPRFLFCYISYFCSTFKLVILLWKLPAFSNGKTRVRTLRILLFPSLSIQRY